ncbi:MULTISPECIES: SufS family cysteine desulfurase [unclassified Pseudoalteromonas]|uniref:SufS family cysteine desulfurase n=1 Tax=unclassified Pseudoalteromonas TaxID=194690 RepID=UPI0025B4AC96|nr:MULTISPECIES: SufS family cysteine desulfurase [unclassified Pseudoalteromonas]MDN3377888.1 SufS family cysteine desulfurase [Pseudoalteromonas sp. APC 3893]MDN3386083.1 SufS family cysteine desulfurase [Pseudoalteromonas sp. APC 4017]
MFAVEKIRADFPILTQQVNNQPLVYLDSAATSQKPQSVITATELFYSQQNANVHRGRHSLSEQATTAYEQTRDKVAQYFNVQSREIVWTKGATEALNLIANGLIEQLDKNSSIVITPLEHHANIVPWQQLALKTGAKLHVLPLEADATLNIAACVEFLKKVKPSVLTLTHASNALGNITNLSPLLSAVKEFNTITVVDGAQGAMHLQPDLNKLDCDFYVFSAHKMLGPTGVGGLYGKYERLNALQPYQTGGEMIETVSLLQSTFRNAPAKFEAGTPNIAGVIGFSAAIDYLAALDKNAAYDYEQRLFNYAVSELNDINGITIYSNLEHNIGTICFNYKDEHPFDIATLLDGFGVAVRSGHHCTQPLMAHLGINGSVRASFCFYNTHQDIDIFINALHECIALLD